MDEATERFKNTITELLQERLPGISVRWEEPDLPDCVLKMVAQFGMYGVMTRFHWHDIENWPRSAQWHAEELIYLFEEAKWKKRRC